MTFNATAVATAAAHAAQTTTQQLYANIDLTKLSWLEQMWAAWYIWIDNPIIATGLMSFLLHEVFFFLVLQGL
jgi:methylsterol monooxygenase